jgi:hypothetical protein
MAEIKRNLRYLQISLRYPRNTVAEIFWFTSKLVFCSPTSSAERTIIIILDDNMT